MNEYITITNIIALTITTFYLTKLYFALLDTKYLGWLKEKLEKHEKLKYWTFCYHCTSFWLVWVPLLVMFVSPTLLIAAAAVSAALLLDELLTIQEIQKYEKK